MKPYQSAAVERILKDRRIILAFEPGLGKSRVALESLVRLGAKNALIICPANLCLNWVDEVAKWNFPLSLRIVPNAKTAPTLDDVCVVSDTLIHLNAAVRARRWQTIIVDESHSLKTPEASRTKAILPMLFKAENIMLLSGTPMPSRPVELFTSLSTVSKGVIGNYHDFTVRYCMGHEEEHGGNIVWVARGAENLEELHERLQPYMIRARKIDVLADLPPKTRMAESLVLSAEATKKLSKMRVQLANLRKKANDGTTFQVGQAKSFFSACWYATAQLKAEPLCAWLEGLFARYPGEKVAVYAHHTCLIDAMHKAFADKRKTVRIDGPTSKKKRQANILSLREGEADLGLLSMTACGTGITLSPGVRIVVIAEMPWTPALALQCEDRVHRVNTERPVLCFYPMGEDSFDQDVFQIIHNKAINNALVLDDDDSEFVF